ncbi:PF07602 domain protein [Leptospira weilii serovar Topaz str. LT2116]|uniref:PF07602 domain protein n=1 Tax=Leptospira weilii serovar Topaz str. LT2116 TaxID=1088540 RepID=M3FPY2_9LEPT|nr:PF07602 domain protein [Leptospira weilii serovar Topaz str. LT2116]
MGGGPAGSEGNNTISCNSYEDIWIPGVNNDPQILFAKNNYWDHFPPTKSFTGPDLPGLDIRHISNATVVRYEEGSVTSNPCN